MRERRAVTQLKGAVVPRQQVETMLTQSLHKRLFDRRLVGRWVRPSGEADRAKATVASWSHRSARGIELTIVTGLNSIGEEGQDRSLVDRRSGQNPRAGRATCDLPNCEPLTAG